MHTIFWLTWVVSFTIIQSLGFGIDQYFIWFMYYVVTLPIFIIHTYLIAYWIVPNTFFKGKYVCFRIHPLCFSFCIFNYRTCCEQ